MYVTLTAENRPPRGLLTEHGVTAAGLPTAVRAGQHLYREGDTVERLYQVTRGVVRLTRMLEDGRRQVISFGYPGDIIGFPSDGRHHTDCDALVDATLFAYRRSALDSGDGDPALHRALLEAALREISAMQDHVMMLGRKSALERVASFLNVLTTCYGEDFDLGRRIELPMSRSDIADFLGLTTETVSRAFTTLRKSGVMSLDGAQTIVVHDPGALADMAAGDD
ncbi:helix-turn-helix domain-containing protein [Tateyamaria sp. ANG-S1]|uniref:helix-turn-helix domain-containing protein n=1 Tax=Tateyamaria sp. ANG-S1 TaxID=1577905 RepID=UPI00057D2921|nr:helix-turn-helix domain-containing protein [Tateyamaria sp. ANG-S1]KIC51114.1 transcriptional regulator [Tateyamaria sp. ANG-S1]